MNQTDPNVYVDCLNGNPAPAGKVCRFDVNTLGPCTKDNGYGYPEGKPCVLLKLNKVGTLPRSSVVAFVTFILCVMTGVLDLLVCISDRRVVCV